MFLLSAAGCGSAKVETVAELPEPVFEVVAKEPEAWYLTAFKQMDYKRGNRFDFRCAGEGCYYVSREEFETYTDTAGKTQERVTMCLYRVDENGNSKKLTEFHPLALESEHPGCFNVAAVDADKDGCLAVLEEEYRYWSDAPANVAKYSEAWYAQYNATEQYYIRRLDKTGKELSCSMLEDPTESGYVYMHGLMLVDEDTFLVLCTGVGVCAYNYEGKLLYTIPLEEEAEELVEVSDQFAVRYRLGGKQCLQLLNRDTRNPGKSCFLPEGAYAIATGNEVFDFCYTDLSDGCLYGGSWNGSVEKLFCWRDCGVDGSFVEYCTVGEDETITCVSTLWRSGFRSCNSGIATVKRLSKEESGVLSVTLASLRTDRDVTNFAVMFNRTLCGSNIAIRDYSVYGDKAALRLRSDLMDSESPDLIDLNDLDREELIRSGLLTDLRANMEDSGISLVNCILNAGEASGGIYGTCTQFTLTVNLNAVPYTEKSAEDMLTENFTETVVTDDKMPDETEAGGAVSEENGQRNAPAEAEKVNAEEMLRLSFEIRTMEELYRLVQLRGNFAGYELSLDSVILHPEEEKFAMCAASKEKVSAWQFLQRYFSFDYQKENVSTFPTNGDLLEYQLQKYTEARYEILDDGTYLEQEDGSRTERPFTTLLLEENVELNLFSLSAEQVEWIHNVFSVAEPERKSDEIGITIMPETEMNETTEPLQPEAEARAVQTAVLYEAIRNLLNAPAAMDS